jgi:MtfA peptidase
MLGALVRRMKRDKWMRAPFPEAWASIVEKRLSFAKHFAPDERARFLAQTHAFLREKRWEGVNVDVTDEMRVTISGLACRLTRNIDLSLYDDLVSIVIYPSSIKHDDKQVLGLAHRFGTVVLSWNAVLSGAANTTDGLNTALHEFAHVLDLKDGDFDGTPPFDRPSEAHAWARAFAPRFLELRKAPERNVLREYGATNEAEFFAVATEAFFEKPEQLKKRAPGLYDELAKFYRVTP